MRIAFVSNYLNHHQLHLCNQLYMHCEEFYFVCTGQIPRERLKIGYEDMNSKYSYAINMYENNQQRRLVYRIIMTFDVVIFGACPSKLIELRMSRDKLSFLYTERFLKNGLWCRFIPSTRKKIQNRVVRYQDKKLYVLCASAYASYDLYLCGYRKPCYQWGYFTEVPNADISELMKKKENPHCSILWVGRLIRWKRTKDVILLARKLMSQNIDFTINIIGTGNYENRLRMLVKALGLSERVHLLGSMPPDRVKKYMEEANIFISTSNFMEGWGAVINEAMSCGCAVVASHAVGSVPYLIEHKKNGLIYQSGNNGDLYHKVRRLINHPKLQTIYGTKAYDTMVHTWNPEVAASRLIEISINLLHGKRIWYHNGPCSRAYIVKEDWFPNNMK